MSYDLALLELMNEPENPDVIRPVCLPTVDSFLQSGEECAVLGWGKTEGMHKSWNFVEIKESRRYSPC